MNNKNVPCDQLAELWDQIQTGNTPDWDPGKAFEYLIPRAFECENLTVRPPYRVTLPLKIGTVEQIDGVVYFMGRGFLIESKDHQEPLDIESVAKLRMRLERRPPGTMGLIFTSRSTITAPAELFAQFSSPMNILFWGPIDIDAGIRHKSMEKILNFKMCHAIENGMPNIKYRESNHDDH